MKWLLLVLCVTFGVLVTARHIHPHGANANTAHMVMDDDVKIPSDEDYIDDEIRSVKPTRFVPINSALYFKDYEPCEEGYVRDLLGVCRELWN